MYKNLRAAAAVLLASAGLVNSPTARAQAVSDPVLTIGHGAIIGRDGRPVTPTLAFIETVQRFYLKTLLDGNQSKEAKARVPEAEIEKARKSISTEVEDKILANAVLIDWLLEKAPPGNLAHVTSVNNALRWHYVREIQKKPVLPIEDRWGKGLEHEKAKRLETKLGVKILTLTKAGGEEYCRECVEAGVPIPTFMFGEEWRFVGELDNEFISETRRAEVWIHESTSPRGVCIALPRFRQGSDEAELFGVICLGTETSKVCFFDNPSGKTFQRGVRVDFKREFVGGRDLVANGGGICTDCHAGENPYIVHPEKPAFAAVIDKLQSRAWHDPLVDASWPQNPGPTTQLDAVSSTGRCDDCHRAGSAGRFPEISSILSGYCNTVLGTAAGTSVKRTMPPFGGNRNDFISHINSLQQSCGMAPSGSGVDVEVTYQNDPGVLSPPIVIDPLYQCATSVAVRGAVLDAKVSLLVNGIVVGTIARARSPYQLEFTGLPALAAGQKVTARQEKDGASAESAIVTVRDHKVDYPAGLPAPVIDPTLIYECAEVIAVRHVPGATVKILTNGGSPMSYTHGSTGWTIFRPGKRPFVVGDKFTATISLCNETSPESAPATAVRAPANIPATTFVPAAVFAGQELVRLESLTNGSQTKISVPGRGPLGSFTTPVSWRPEFDLAAPPGQPMSAGETLRAAQTLCRATSGGETPPARKCDELPAPRIQHPIVGARHVVVLESVPGARVRVYDASDKELGDGSGSIIVLNRAITGADTLTIVQEVGKCTSKKGYRVGVRNTKAQPG